MRAGCGNARAQPVHPIQLQTERGSKNKAFFFFKKKESTQSRKKKKKVPLGVHVLQVT